MKKNVLILEENKEAREAYEAKLGRKYNLLFARNTEDALRQLNRNRISVMILDIGLPEGIWGTDFVGEIRGSQKYRNLPVIFASTVSVYDMRLTSKPDKDVIYLRKPFDTNDLDAAIERMLYEKEDV